MHEPELIRELSTRAGISPGAARAVVEALGALRASPAAPADPRDPAAVDALLAAARRHPLGLEFLADGFLGSVAAAFHVHAFTVEAARERLSAGKVPLTESEAAACLL